MRVVSQRIGRAEQADDTWGTHYSEFEVDLQRGLSGAQSEEAQSEMRKVLAGFPGVNFALKPFLTERVEESLSGYTASVIVNIYGNDLDVLDATAQEVARELGGIEGATEVQLQSPPGLPQLTIRPRKADLERWGLDAVEVLNVLRTAYQGDIVGQTYEGSRVVQRHRHPRHRDARERHQCRQPAAAHARGQLRVAAAGRGRVPDRAGATRSTTSAASVCRPSPPTSSAAT